MDLEKQQKQPKFIVCVRCLTFNHANYIEDAMNGFTMQETNFPYVCTILDDASTDGEQEVIKKYLQEHFDLEDRSVVRNEETEDYILNFAQHKTNRNCYFAVLYLKYNHYSINKSKEPYIEEWMTAKYIAACEGDDYWINKRKLEITFSFLEEHPHYVLACHRNYKYYQESGKYTSDRLSDIFFVGKNGVSFGRFHNRFINWNTQTLATVYRSDILTISTEGYPHPITDGIKSYFPLKFGKGYCFNDYMATYRVNQGGVWSRLPQEEKLYSNWIMFKRFNDYEKSVFSKLSYLESYARLLQFTKWQGFKDATYKQSILYFSIIYKTIIRTLYMYYRIRNKFN